MSLALAYAETLAAAKSDVVDAEATVPAPYHCAHFDAHVDEDGNFVATPGTGQGTVFGRFDYALELAAWIVTTFGD
jgi:hypothetical protein